MAYSASGVVMINFGSLFHPINLHLNMDVAADSQVVKQSIASTAASGKTESPAQTRCESDFCSIQSQSQIQTPFLGYRGRLPRLFAYFSTFIWYKVH